MKHKIKHVHFVGIGGVGMSGIAEVLVNLGYHVSGSDLGENAVTRNLQKLGARIYKGHAAEQIEGANAVVISSAVAEDNPEVQAARAKTIPVVPRALMLAELMRLKQGIAVAGTHGKTTTTSLTASVLGEGGLDPTFVIGGRVEAVGSNAKLGKGDFIVVEADESDASFLYLQPCLAIVTNIDADHMHTYEHSVDKLRQAFIYFLQHLPFYGVAVLCIDDPGVRDIVQRVPKTVLTYGLSEDAKVRAVDVEADGGQMRFRVRTAPNGGPGNDFPVTLNLPGVHNVRNALAATAVGLELGISPEKIASALASFKGVGRRFEQYGEMRLPDGGRCLVVDDYGHHPVEMEATLAAARGAYPDRRLLLAFQPHRYTRTRDCFEDFVKVLSTPDALVLTDVYPAGEAPIVAADGRALARAVRVHGKVEPLFVDTVTEMPDAIRAAARDGDLVLVMGAGSIGGVPAALVAS